MKKLCCNKYIKSINTRWLTKILERYYSPMGIRTEALLKKIFVLIAVATTDIVAVITVMWLLSVLLQLLLLLLSERHSLIHSVIHVVVSWYGTIAAIIALIVVRSTLQLYGIKGDCVIGIHNDDTSTITLLTTSRFSFFFSFDYYYFIQCFVGLIIQALLQTSCNTRYKID